MASGLSLTIRESESLFVGDSEIVFKRVYASNGKNRVEVTVLAAREVEVDRGVIRERKLLERKAS